MSWKKRTLPVCLASLVVFAMGSARAAAADYPLTLTADASLKTESATVTSSVTIRVDRLMDESQRTRVIDALTHGGYIAFIPPLRALPPIGRIALQKRSVDIRYAYEQPEATGRRLVLVADRPLFFLNSDPAKAKAGYELTIVELHFDAQGAVTGTMAGAARVKPSPNGPVLDDYAEAPVRLTARVPRP